MIVGIRQPAAETLIQELTTATDEDPGLALSHVMRERIDRLRQETETQTKKREDLRAILARLAPRLQNGPASWEIDELLYDERGLPRTD